MLFHRGLFLRLVHRRAAHGFIEIDQMAVKVGAVDAGEPGLAVDGQPHMPVPSTIVAFMETMVLMP